MPTRAFFIGLIAAGNEVKFIISVPPKRAVSRTGNQLLAWPSAAPGSGVQYRAVTGEAAPADPTGETTSVMPHWVRVAEFRSARRERRWNDGRGSDRGVIQRGRNAFYALDGVCPHQGGPLGKGCLMGRIVTCPWHGWQFTSAPASTN